MADEALITRGLELFAAGDLSAAARAWLEARKEGSGDPQLVLYLDQLRAVAPEAYAAVALELGLSDPPPSKSPSAAPMLAPVAFEPVLVPKPEPEPAALEVEYEGPIELLVPTTVVAPVPPVVEPAVAELPVLPVPPAPLSLVVDEVGPSVESPWGADALLGPAIDVKGSGGGLELVAVKAKPLEPIAVPVGELAQDEAKLKERLGLDDFSGALELAEQLLAANPMHALALSARERCRTNLQQIYNSKLGDLERTPKVLIPPHQVIWLDLDHRSGFLLAQVDGLSTYAELIELSGMDRLEALRLMAQLVQKGVIGV